MDREKANNSRIGAKQSFIEETDKETKGIEIGKE